MFKPDKTIFSGGIEFEFTLLSSRLRELAYLNGGVKIVLGMREMNYQMVLSRRNLLISRRIKEYVQYVMQKKILFIQR